MGTSLRTLSRIRSFSKMKLFTCATLAFAAVSAQADYSSYYDSNEASDYIDAYYAGNSTDLIDERRKTQAEKDAAKANRQKNKNKNKNKHNINNYNVNYNNDNHINYYN